VQSFKGVLVALATPMDEAGRLDEPAFRGHLDGLIDAGVNGVVPGGSTGEVMTLDADEYRRLIALTVEHVAGRVSVVAGCSANATHQVIANCRAARDAGVDGLMVTHPFYSHPTEEELYRHYEDIANSAALPIVVYNNPGTTGVDASPELLGRLSQLPNIEYVKESSGDASRLTRILDASGGGMTVLSGTDHMALDHFTTGAKGWVSASANVLAAQCVALYRLAVEDEDLQAARRLYREIHPFLTYSEVSGHGIQAIKASMVFVGRPLGEPRAPLRAISPQTLAEIKPMVERALRAPLPAAAGQG
jgi:4-hydroxy-tetrahydrodipicolinate synthase